MKIFYLIFLIISTNTLLACSEKVIYSGKIINNEISYLSFKNKNQLINALGKPSYTDFIEKKYYYYSEKKIFKNFFNQKISSRLILVFKFDINENIISSNKYDLNNINDIKFIKEKTENNIINRGLLEKWFGGVSSTSIPNTAN